MFAPFRRLGRDPQRAGKGSARGYADEYAFFRRELLAVANGVGARDRQDAIDQFHIHGVPGQLRNEVRRPALHRVGLETRMRRRGRPVGQPLLLDPGLEQRRIRRLADDDLRVGALRSQNAADALQRAAGAVAGHPEIEPVAGEVVDDFARGGAGMEVRIGFVLELPCHEPAVGFGQFDRLLDHSDRSLGGRRQHDLGAEKAHQSPPFDAEGLGHRDNKRIAFRGADHGEADAGVAARRLDDGLAGLELAGLLRRLDDPQSQTVLDRAQRVEGLDFHIEVDPVRGEAVDPDDRRVSDCLQYALKSRHANPPLFPRGARQGFGPTRRRVNLSRSKPFRKASRDREGDRGAAHLSR